MHNDKLQHIRYISMITSVIGLCNAQRLSSKKRYKMCNLFFCSHSKISFKITLPSEITLCQKQIIDQSRCLVALILRVDPPVGPAALDNTLGRIIIGTDNSENIQIA